jgi:hypothetical protein
MTKMSHVTVVVGDDYFHLKKMEDGTLALDITPFDPKTEIFKREVSSTKATNSHIMGMGEFTVYLYYYRPQDDKALTPTYSHVDFSSRSPIYYVPRPHFQKGQGGEYPNIQRWHPDGLIKAQN